MEYKSDCDCISEDNATVWSAHMTISDSQSIKARSEIYFDWNRINHHSQHPICFVSQADTSTKGFVYGLLLLACE